MVNTQDYTVGKLIELWESADLSVSDGTVEATGLDEIMVSYEGSDGTLEVEYTISEPGGYRTDSNENFHIAD